MAMGYNEGVEHRRKKLATQPTRQLVNDGLQKAMNVIDEIDRERFTDPDFVRLMSAVVSLISAVSNLALLEAES
jgi:hypothetical protein